MPPSKTIVSIDGPAGSGKSTIARIVASKLGFTYVDTGAMYRAITWKALEEGVAPLDEPLLKELARASKLEMTEDKIFINGHDVTDKIRTLPVTRSVSAVSSLGGVREAMVELQRSMAQAAEKGAVIEGRDIGTVVFPDATLKIYLDASVEERARRRQLDLKEAHVDMDLEKLKEEITRRDEYDSTRKHSPLRKPEDSVVLDTTDKSIDQVVDEVISLIESKERV